MRILLDENIPKRLKGELGGHEVWTVREKRWAGKKNGELLALAIQDSFDVFITADQNIQYQHNLANYAIIVVFLAACRRKGFRSAKQRFRGSFFG